MRYLSVDRLAVEVHPDGAALGAAAARAAAAYLRGVTADRGRARVIFACAPSQDEFLAALVKLSMRAGPWAFDWTRVTVFHMDEYVGLADGDSRSFNSYLERHLLSRVSAGSFHPLKAGKAGDSEVCARYAELLAAAPVDLACMGIGENGHLAFNDPPVADFGDPLLVKQVPLDLGCRKQQVNDGCFPTLDAVPGYALTLTVPVFRQARRLSVHVSGPRKAGAVRTALEGPIGEACPASILRLHPDATLFLDEAAGAGV